MLLASGSSQATAASGNLTVTAVVPSTTILDSSGCTAASSIDLGSQLPGLSTRTAADCAVTFGSTNDTSALRLAQTDASGAAMFLPANGTLDMTFGTSGMKRDAGAAGTVWDSELVPASAGATAGRIVAVGTNNDTMITRYNADGSPDTSFDGDGRKFVDYTGTGCVDVVTDVEIQPDGKIVVVGAFNEPFFFIVWNCYAWTNSMVMRFNTDGSLDTTFSGDGKLTLYAGTVGAAYAVTLEPSGNILVGGGEVVAAAQADTMVARISPTGTVLDSATFDLVNGIWLPDSALRIASQSDGKVLIGGARGNGSSHDHMVARFNSNLTLDNSFGNTIPAGVWVENSGDGAVNGMQQLANGKIVITGDVSSGSGGRSFVKRLTSTGTTDATFGTGGVTWIDPSTGVDRLGHNIVQDDGKIISAGYTTPGDVDSMMIRVKANGQLDPTFDGDGISIIDQSAGNTDNFYGITRSVDGVLVGGGTSNNAVGLVKYASVTMNNYSNGVTDFTNGANFFGACLASTSATANWTVNAACPLTSGVYWNPIAPTGSTVTHTTATGAQGATANMRFAMKTSTSQAPGDYIAPVTIDVVAPAL